MPQTSLEISSGVPYTPLVTFSWGDANVARYCRWTENLTIDSNLFTHEPSLKVFMDQPQTGGTEDVPVEIQMRLTQPPFNKLALPYKHAKVDVLIQEVSPGDDTSLQDIFKGQLGKITVQPQNQYNLAKAKINGVKRRLKGKAGLQALSECILIFGTPPCGYPLAANIIDADITEIGTNGVPNRITVDMPTSANLANNRWRRGRVVVDGLRITIRKSHDDGRFDLREIPPPDWLDAECQMVPGCAKTIAACRVHGQEENFMGFGIAMPNHNPVIFAD